MFCIPRCLSTGLVVLGLLLTVALSASAASQQDGVARTDVKIEAQDMEAKAEVPASPIVSPSPLTLESLTSTHAVEVHPYVATPDTADTHTLWVKSK